MGLAFLNKKSFHTGSFQNIEKVWKAEQKEKELERKIKEAHKKLKEERHYEDIKKIQVINGLLPKSRLQRLDWMYEGGAIKNMSSEEYLLGKPYEEPDPDKQKQEWRPVLCKESTANPANEIFTKTHEDPLFTIKQEALRRKQDIMQDPAKLQKLQQKIEDLKVGRSTSVARPSPALILIEDERIANVIEFPEAVHFEEISKQYSEWSPRDVGDLCISPGLIDCNVEVNGKWDGVGLVSKAAISGGVTFFLAEPSLYRLETDFAEEIYCDVGRMAVVGLSTLEESACELQSGAFALKAYMFPPSAYVNGVAQQLQSVLTIAHEEDVPLIIDASYPSPRMLYMASPCRLLPLEDRAKMEHFSEDKFFAGAFPEEIDPRSPSGSSSSGSEDEEEEYSESPPQPFASSFTSPVVKLGISEPGRISIGYGISHVSKKIHTVKSFQTELSRSSNPSESKILRVPTMVNINTRRKSFQCHNIYEDLQKRIQANQGNIENLSTIELMAYEEAGETKFGLSGGKKRSSSICDRSPKLEVLEELFRGQPSVSEFNPNPSPNSRRDRFARPTGLQISRGTPTETNKDRQYIYHIANHPDHWETNGVMVARKAIAVRHRKGYTGKIHFCNLSSAASFAKVGKSKGDVSCSEQITTETCPSYLYFTMDSIQNGDTRFKMLPPIRSKTNCNLLWDLLKMEQVDILSSHHSYIPSTYKFPDSGSFKKAVNGITSLGYSLQTVWTKLRAPVVESRSHYLVRMSKWMSLAPAKMLGISHERGSIAPGKYADLVLWDPESPSRSLLLFPCPSPYTSESLLGKVQQVYVRGQLAFDDGRFSPVGVLQSRSRTK